MATAIIFGAPGAGKTVNSTLVPGKTLLLSTDNSSIVLKHFVSFSQGIQENLVFVSHFVSSNLF